MFKPIRSNPVDNIEVIEERSYKILKEMNDSNQNDFGNTFEAIDFVRDYIDNPSKKRLIRAVKFITEANDFVKYNSYQNPYGKEVTKILDDLMKILEK